MVGFLLGCWCGGWLCAWLSDGTGFGARLEAQGGWLMEQGCLLPLYPSLGFRGPP